MTYDNSLDRCNEFSTPSGNQFEDVYSVKVLKDGTCVLEVSGKKDIKAEINAWKEHTDMAYIIRAMQSGTYRPRENVFYGDFTDAPESMAEAFQTMINAEKAFYELPLDVRNQFDNNWSKWMVMANTETERFMDLMGFKKDESVPVDEKESGE